MNLLAALGFVVGLLLLTWIAADASRRGRNWLAWSVPVLFVGVFGAIPWLIRRRRAPVVSPLSARRLVVLGAAALSLLILKAIVSAYVTTFLVQAARIEGQAMVPTLADQDRVIVNRLVYQLQDPTLDEIVMLRYPLRPERLFIKRVIGREGDQVRVADGMVYLNGVEQAEAFVASENRSHDNWGPQVVPEGYYFVLGDNRRNSSDSRHWGFVPKKYILGRVASRWWPMSSMRTF